MNYEQVKESGATSETTLIADALMSSFLGGQGEPIVEVFNDHTLIVQEMTGRFTNGEFTPLKRRTLRVEVFPYGDWEDVRGTTDSTDSTEG